MLLGIAGCLACLIILLLIIPMDVIFSQQRCPSIKRHISVSLMFGLIRLPVPSSSIKNYFVSDPDIRNPRLGVGKTSFAVSLSYIKAKAFLVDC